MATEVIMPKLGQTMEHGTITEWLVSEGDTVRRGQPLFKIESDKAVLEANAPSTGVLRKIFVPQGGSAPILTAVAIIAKEDEDISAMLSGEGNAPTAPPPQELESAVPAAPVRAEGKRIFASPRARSLARAKGVDLAGIAGTGPKGRIVEKDVVACLERQPRSTAGARADAAARGIDLAEVGLPEGVERLARRDLPAEEEPENVEPEAEAQAVPVEIGEFHEPLTGVRAIIAERMSASVHTTASFTLTTEVDAGAFIAWRQSLRQQAGEGQRVPTYNDMLARLLVVVLREHPDLNARLEREGIMRTSSVNIGVAVDTPRGLMVPVVHGAQALTLQGITDRGADLVVKAREGQLAPDDMSGGTFTISNLGMYDIDGFSPIVNMPEVAILGVGRIAERAVVRDGQVVARPTMVLSLTVDHRLVDGAPAARFLQRLKRLVENPLLAL